MALNFWNEEIETLAAALAELTGETQTEAVTQALRERLRRLRGICARKPRLADQLDEIALHCAALPLLDHRSVDEILGYGERDPPGPADLRRPRA